MNNADYLTWKRNNLPGITCPDLNAVANFVTALPADTPHRPDILAAVERIRDANIGLRITAKRCALKLFDIGVEPPEPD